MSANAECQICNARYVLESVHFVVLRIFFQTLHLGRKIYVIDAVKKICVAPCVERVCPRIYFLESFERRTLMLSLLFEFLYHQLGGFIYVAAAECYHKIALFDILDNIVGNLFKGVEPYASGNLLGEL